MKASLLLFACVVVVAVLWSLPRVLEDNAAARPAAAVRTDSAKLLANRPVAFVPNFGQWEHPARYVARMGNVVVFLQDEGLFLSIERGMERGKDQTDVLRLPRPALSLMEGIAVRLGFPNSKTPKLVPRKRLSGCHTYLSGEDGDRWRTVPLYGAVQYLEPWPGVDLLFYEKDWHLEYDIDLRPGSDLALVEFVVEGIEDLSIDDDGALVLQTSLGLMRQPPPSTWEIDSRGNRTKMAAHYQLRDTNRFGFTVPDWTGEQRLLVDPEILWSTFVGGNGIDWAQTAVVDDAGIVTIAGYTNSPTYPTTSGAWQTSYTGYDGFVSRLDPSLPPSQQLLYSTYVGAGVVNALSVAPTTGIVTIAGQTQSPAFPTTPGAWSTTFNGVADAFVMRLDPSRSGAQQLLYSTFVGGNNYDEAWAVSVDSTGVVTIGGYTHSMDYPTTPGAWDTSFNGVADACVTRIDPSRPTSQQLTWSTFLGGTGAATSGGGAGIDHAYGLAVDDLTGVVTLVGRTWCADFPTTQGAWDTTHNGLFDGYVVRLDPSMPAAQQLVYSTFLGGSRYDHAFCVSIIAPDVLVVTGVTSSTDFPTTQNAWDGTQNGSDDVFVLRLMPSLPASQQLLYSTYLGGPRSDFSLQHSVDSTGTVTLAGYSEGTFPTTVGALYTTPNGSLEAFAARLDPSRPSAEQLLYSTFLGGASGDSAASLVVDPEGVVTIAGGTASWQFPTTLNAWSRSYMGAEDAFVTRLDMLPLGVRGVGDSSPGCNGRPLIGVTTVPQVGQQSFTVTCSNAPPSASGWLFAAAGSLSSPIPVFGARLWVDPGSAFLVTGGVQSDGAGYAALNLPIPNDPAMAGFQVYAQYGWVGPSTQPRCPALGISASRALEITVQP